MYGRGLVGSNVFFLCFWVYILYVIGNFSLTPLGPLETIEPWKRSWPVRIWSEASTMTTLGNGWLLAKLCCKLLLALFKTVKIDTGLKPSGRRPTASYIRVVVALIQESISIIFFSISSISIFFLLSSFSSSLSFFFFFFFFPFFIFFLLFFVQFLTFRRFASNI